MLPSTKPTFPREAAGSHRQKPVLALGVLSPCSKSVISHLTMKSPSNSNHFIKVSSTLNMGLALVTLRSRVVCSTNWASQVPLQLFLELTFKPLLCFPLYCLLFKIWCLLLKWKMREEELADSLLPTKPSQHLSPMRKHGWALPPSDDTGGPGYIKMYLFILKSEEKRWLHPTRTRSVFIPITSYKL